MLMQEGSLPLKAGSEDSFLDALSSNLITEFFDWPQNAPRPSLKGEPVLKLG